MQWVVLFDHHSPRRLEFHPLLCLLPQKRVYLQRHEPNLDVELLSEGRQASDPCHPTANEVR